MLEYIRVMRMLMTKKLRTDFDFVLRLLNFINIRTILITLSYLDDV